MHSTKSLAIGATRSQFRGAHLQGDILLVLEVPISGAIAVAIKTGSLGAISLISNAEIA